MAGAPHPLLQTGDDVSKSVGRSRLPIWFSDPAELALYDMTTANVIMVGDFIYRKSPSLSALPASGLDILIDGNDNRWRMVEGTTYLFGFFSTQGVGANELLMIHPITVNVVLPENLVGSWGVALNTATDERRFPVKKNDSDLIGEIIFSPALANPTFESDEITLVPGDFVTARGQTSGSDATLANFGVTFVGSR